MPLHKAALNRMFHIITSARKLHTDLNYVFSFREHVSLTNDVSALKNTYIARQEKKNSLKDMIAKTYPTLNYSSYPKNLAARFELNGSLFESKRFK